jgi:hypothetical protein
MRRALHLPGLLLIVLLWPAGQASAGGATFEFDQRYYEPGVVVEASSSVWMGRGAMGLLDEGPFFAHLVPSDRWIDPPHIPAPSRPLGMIRFIVTGPKEATAHVSFVVPDVPSAMYGISYCNDPCTVATVGDLIGGWFSVAEDAEQATLAARISRLELRNDRKVFRLGEMRRENTRLLRRAEVSTDRATDLRSELDRLGTRLEPSATREGFGVLALMGIGAAALAAGFAVGRIRRSSRRPTPVEEAERVLERV